MPDDQPWLTLVAGGTPEGSELSSRELLARHSGDEPQGRPIATGPDAPLVLLFTSGTTGAPKGVPVPVRALASFRACLEFGLDVREDDVFWNAADPGWAYGLYSVIRGRPRPRRCVEERCAAGRQACRRSRAHRDGGRFRPARRSGLRALDRSRENVWAAPEDR
ncbi:AMP-binding protein [Streptomyces sp. NPDC005648]|uniref:AMP-binding protein n=1 Tax=Streptomyces sp. NPDC005648 TaxID=3157044 RepID=UPI0033B50E85